jgi:lysophospholipase L1-like esterase
LLTVGLRIGIVFVSSLFCLLVAEIALRIFVGPLPGRAHHHLLCEHDPLLGWRKVPNARERYTTSEYSVEEQINSKGLRGPEFSYEKPSDVFRILVLGDSFTEGYSVDLDALFTEVLSRQINRASAGRRYEVINAGTGGYSTDQELLFFRSEGRKYDADLVLLMFVTNDVWYNAQPEYPRAPKPLFQLHDGELVLTNTPVPEPVPIAVADTKSRRPPLRNRVKGALSTRSVLYNFVRDRTKSNYWLYLAAIRMGLAGPPDDSSAPIDVPREWGVFQTVGSAAVGKAWRMTEALLLALHEDARAESGRLVVVNIPRSFDLYEDQWDAFKRKYGVFEGAWSPSAVTDTLREVCDRNQIELLDLTPDFRAAIAAGRDRPDPLFFPIDGHWTASGHQVAGERLAEYVIEHQRLSSPVDPLPEH